MDTPSLETNKLTRSLVSPADPKRLLLTIIIASIILGTITGFILSNKNKGGLTSSGLGALTAKNPAADTKTFRDFAEGVIKTNPQAAEGEYSEGSHLLQREGAVPVALTSSVVDLSKYEGKKVKVFGETQKALKAGWLMDVGKVEEIK